jgi:arsenite methyltransferase
VKVGATGSPGFSALASSSQPTGDDLKACCATVYADPAVRWMLGDVLHPGGERTTRRALELSGLRPGQRLLDVASGSGASAILAARDLGAEVVGVEYGIEAVRAAQNLAVESSHGERVRFLHGDAEALPVEDGSFDAVLCECSLCTFPDKPRAAAEFRRVLRPGGKLALADVVVEEGVLPAPLSGALATVACVGGALSRAGYEQLLEGAGLSLLASELRYEDADLFTRGLEERLRGARLLGISPPPGSPLAIAEAIEMVQLARRAIADGALGYAILIAKG